MKKLQQITETNNTGPLLDVYLTLINLAWEAEKAAKAARAKADLAWVAFRDSRVTL